MIIALCGQKQSGKSSVTTYLENAYDFEEVSWAYPLKEIIGRELFDLDDEILYGDSPKREHIIEEWGLSGRQILQLVGTECFRKVIHPDFWVKLGIKRIKTLQEEGRDVVVSDCRFPNEMEAVKELGGVTVRIIRLGQESNDQHASETSLNDYKTDHTLMAAEGQLPELFKQIETLIQ